jgi:hypothetical protein
MFGPGFLDCFQGDVKTYPEKVSPRSNCSNPFPGAPALVMARGRRSPHRPCG